MDTKFTKNIVNQLFALMKANENSEEIGVNFTICKSVISVGCDEEDIINKDWCGGTCEHEYAINFRDWTQEEKFITSISIDVSLIGKSKGDINYYDCVNNKWNFIGNIYEMNVNEEVGGITRVKTTEPADEEKRYKIFFPEDEIILNMNKLQYDFCIKLYEETNLFEDNFIDLQDITEITM